MIGFSVQLFLAFRFLLAGLLASAAAQPSIGHAVLMDAGYHAHATVVFKPFSGIGKKRCEQAEVAGSETEDRNPTGKKHGKAVKEFTAFFYQPHFVHPVITEIAPHEESNWHHLADLCLLFRVLRI